MRMTKEQKGIKVLEWLEAGPQTFEQLLTLTQMRRVQVREGIEWLRDYDPNCLIVLRDGNRHSYKLAAEADEVREYLHARSRVLYRMALRLERMVVNARKLWPDDRILRVMEKHLHRLREDVEEAREDSA